MSRNSCLHTGSRPHDAMLSSVVHAHQTANCYAIIICIIFHRNRAEPETYANQQRNAIAIQSDNKGEYLYRVSLRVKSAYPKNAKMFKKRVNIIL